MDRPKTIADLKAAMWGLFEKLPEEKRQKTDFIAIDSIGRSWSYFSIKCFEKYWGRDGEKLGNIDLTKYPPDSWKQSLILVRDGKRVEETKTESASEIAYLRAILEVPAKPAESGFVPVEIKDFDENGELDRGDMIYLTFTKEPLAGVHSLKQLNEILERKWLALGGQKGDK